MSTALAVIQPLRAIISVFEHVLRFFHDSVGVGWGFSIIMLTICVRALLIPLTVKQFKSMQEMQRIAPEMKALQAKYKEDKQRLNQEMMKLYQEHKVNPFGSCLPTVAQFPVFISLFYMLRKDLKEDICGPALRQAASSAHKAFNGSFVQKTSCTDAPDINHAHAAAKFLFVPDLTDQATGAVLVALIVMYVGSQLLSSLLMSATTADPTQRKLMIALPFIFTLFIIRFPAGLLVYWITTNLWTVGQQYLVRRSVGHLPPLKASTDPGDREPGPTKPAAPRGSPEPSPPAPGGFLGRLASAGRPTPATDTGAGGGADPARRAAAPPPPPRTKKKKRSGRRR